MTLLNFAISVVLIVLVAVVVSKPFTRTIWLLFPYSGLSLKLRAIIVSGFIGRRLDKRLLVKSDSVYTDRYGRTCVAIPHDVHMGFRTEDVGCMTADLFSELAEALAPHLGYDKGTAHVQDDLTIFQFWDAPILS